MRICIQFASAVFLLPIANPEIAARFLVLQMMIRSPHSFVRLYAVTYELLRRRTCVRMTSSVT